MGGWDHVLREKSSSARVGEGQALEEMGYLRQGNDAQQRSGWGTEFQKTKQLGQSEGR